MKIKNKRVTIYILTIGVFIYMALIPSCSCPHKPKHLKNNRYSLRVIPSSQKDAAGASVNFIVHVDRIAEYDDGSTMRTDAGGKTITFAYDRSHCGSLKFNSLVTDTTGDVTNVANSSQACELQGTASLTYNDAQTQQAVAVKADFLIHFIELPDSHQPCEVTYDKKNNRWSCKRYACTDSCILYYMPKLPDMEDWVEEDWKKFAQIESTGTENEDSKFIWKRHIPNYVPGADSQKYIFKCDCQ
jgi:hypothetical protein